MKKLILLIVAAMMVACSEKKETINNEVNVVVFYDQTDSYDWTREIQNLPVGEWFGFQISKQPGKSTQTGYGTITFVPITDKVVNEKRVIEVSAAEGVNQLRVSDAVIANEKKLHEELKMVASGIVPQTTRSSVIWDNVTNVLSSSKYDRVYILSDCQDSRKKSIPELQNENGVVVVFPTNMRVNYDAKVKEISDSLRVRNPTVEIR